MEHLKPHKPDLKGQMSHPFSNMKNMFVRNEIKAVLFWYYIG